MRGWSPKQPVGQPPNRASPSWLISNDKTFQLPSGLLVALTAIRTLEVLPKFPVAGSMPISSSVTMKWPLVESKYALGSERIRTKRRDDLSILHQKCWRQTEEEAE